MTNLKTICDCPTNFIKEMEKERKAREAEEKEKVERLKKIKDQFQDSNSQWEKDKNDIQAEALKEKKLQEAAAKENPVAAAQPKPNIAPKAAITPDGKPAAAPGDKIEIKPDAKPESQAEPNTPKPGKPKEYA